MSKPVMYEWMLSPSAEKIRRSFRQKDVEYASEEVYFFDRSKIEAVSGQRQVPIVTHAGKVIGPRTLHIMMYIDEAFPGPSLFPGSSLGLCSVIDTYVEKVLNALGVRAYVPLVAPMLTSTPERKKTFDEFLIKVCGHTSDQLMQEQAAGFPSLIPEYLAHLRYLDDHFATRRTFLGEELSAADHSVYSNYWYMKQNPEWEKVFATFDLPHLKRWGDEQEQFLLTRTIACVKQESPQASRSS